MTVRVRFAPSPTGRLHLGNARGAVINWLFARRNAGRFILRLDDTDRERSTEDFARGIEEDLRWLGLGWDEFARQSDRLDRYDAAVERLKAAGRLYACYETPEELARRRSRKVVGGGAPVYDRAALRLTEAQKKAYVEEGRKPYWRFLLHETETSWTDAIRGPVSFHGANLSDPVLIRADGTPLYILSSVVDDIEMDVTHIIRGEDHVTNTAVQIQLFAALGRDPASITFAHFPLMTDAGGQALSKRLGSLSISGLREQGIEAMAINSLVARLGTSDPVEPKLQLAELVEGFDLAKFSRASPKLDLEDLKRLNARLLHEMPFDTVRDRLASLGLGGVDEGFWRVVRQNITTLPELREWWQVCRGEVTPVIEDPGFTARAAELLPPEPWTEETWGSWTKAVGAATERKGRALFMPLRLALTAREHGPELKTLLPMIGRAKAEARLAGKTA